MPLTLDHWNKMKQFINQKAAEANITDGAQQVELFQVHWDELQDEDALDKRFEDIELAQLTLGIPQKEQELAKARQRKKEIEDSRRVPTRPS